MARNRNKEYKQGERINIYLSRDITPEFIDWINKQSDLSNFFLYAAQQLHKQTGSIDVSEVMPRKINFDLTMADRPAPEPIVSPAEKPKLKPEPLVEDKMIDKEEIIDESEEIKKEETWATLDDLDDDFA